MNLSDFDSAHNSALKDLIAERIQASGAISFAEFYELAMYHQRHGYYFTGYPTRDFQSSPNVHPVFGSCIARLLADLWLELDRPAKFEAFEAGAGSGRLAADILHYARASEPDFFDALRYTVQDVTLGGEGAWARLESAGLSSDTVSIAAALPSSPSIEGCILSNELLDALPFRRVRVRKSRLFELRVALEEGSFVEIEAEPRPEVIAHFEALGLTPAEGCDAEVSLVAPAWMARAAGALKRGYVLTLDYGYEAKELYAPWRKRGTLLTFYRHSSGDDPYARIGRQDITTSVDFTSVRRVGEAAGLRTLGSTTQRELLASLGVGEALSQTPDPSHIEAYYTLRRSVMELTDATGLGRITALLMGKDVPDGTPLGFKGISGLQDGDRA
jgi:SAM-dependent MidA family methyltransferase